MLAKQWKQDLLWLAALVLVSLGARLWFIDACGTPLPFWDQWEDTRTVFSPYFQGKLTWAAMFSPHNENRIFLTRVLDLGLLLADGQWDNNVEMVFNAFFYVAALAGFAWLLTRVYGLDFWLLIAILFVAVLSLPFTWENTLYGYDSQFYFLMFFSLCALWFLNFKTAGTLGWFLGAAAAVCSLFAMASGLIAAAAVVGFVILRRIIRTGWFGARPSAYEPRQRLQRRIAGPFTLSEVFTVAICLLVAVAGLKLKVEVPFHQVLKAHSAVQFLAFLGKYLAWPWIVIPPYALFNFFPLLTIVWLYWRYPEARTRAEELILALGIWLGLLAVATAYSRGGYYYPQWRYMDCMCFIMVVNAIALRWIARRHREKIPFPKCFKLAGGLWALAAISGLVLLCGRACRVDIPLRVYHQQQQLFTMRKYLATDDPQALVTPQKEFLARFAAPNEPQDHPKAMMDMLNLPHIRSILPSRARDPLALAPTLNQGFTTNVSPKIQAEVPGETVWSAEAGSALFESEPLSTHFPFLEFRVAGNLIGAGNSLAVQQIDSGKLTEVRPGQKAGTHWQTVCIKAPAGQFKVVAKMDTAAGPFAFQPPRELGPLSRLSQQILASGKWLFFLGIISLSIKVWKSCFKGQKEIDEH